MRLIDADELIMCLEHGVWNSAVEVVKEQPTAYDVENVVEQLKKLPRDSTWNPYSDNINREKAVEVVRAGGKE